MATHEPVFISWSGEQSKLVAKAVRVLLSDVNQRIEPWMSETDIHAGERWGARLSDELNTTDVGILCLTSENINSAWLLFEAGALSKSVSNSLVIPYLLGISRGDIKGPLSQFQAKEADREGTWELLSTINSSMNDAALSTERLRRNFERFWPDLEASIKDAMSSISTVPPQVMTKLVNIMSARFYDSRQIQAMTMFAGEFPLSQVNWNQAPLFVWTEVIQIAHKEGLLHHLVDVVKLHCGIEDQDYLDKLLADIAPE